MTRLALACVLGACAAAPPPHPTPAPPIAPAARTPVPDPVPAVTVAPPAPPTVLELATRADLSLIAIAEAPDCATGAARSWIVSALDAKGAGATCTSDGRCVMFAGVTPEHLSEVMCTKRSLGRPVPAPAWASDMLAALGRVPADQMWQVTPIQDAPKPAVAIQIDDALYVAIETEAGWQRSHEPIDRMYHLAAKRLIDTSPLTGTPSFGVITSSYDGGSESGTETTTLTVVRPATSELAALATIQLGQFTWILPAENRRTYPKAATSLDARPHVEVQLVPAVSRGVLTLAVGTDVLSKELAGRCVHGDDDGLDPPCIRETMRAHAGRYQLTADGFSVVK